MATTTKRIYSNADKYNLMLSLVGYLVHHREVPISKLASHFGVPEEIITKALVTISLSGVGEYRPDELFFVNYDLLEEGIADIEFCPTLDEVPRLSVQQVAAISAGLNYLKSLVSSDEQKAIQKLIDTIAKGKATDDPAPIVVHPGSVDADLLLLRRAIADQRRIRCEYLNSKGELGQREIDPLALESVDQFWYLRGYCLIRQEVRAFRVERMRATEMTETEIGEEAKKSILTAEIYVAKSSDTEVTIDLDPEAYPLASTFHLVQPAVKLPEGVMRVVVSIGHLPNLGRIIARYGGAARVVSPPEARQVVRDFAIRALGVGSSRQAEIIGGED